MKQILLISFLFICANSLHAQFYNLVETYDSKTLKNENTQPEFRDSQYVFKGVNSTNQKLEIRFKNPSTWTNAQIPYSTILEILQDIQRVYNDSVNSYTSGKSFYVNVLPDQKILYRHKESDVKDMDYIQMNQTAHPLKLSQDTIHIYSDYFHDNEKKGTIIYSFIINDALNIDKLNLSEFDPFIDSINQTIHMYSQKWKNPDSRTKKIIGIYADNKYASKNFSLGHTIHSSFFMDASTGLYSSTNTNVRFILEGTVGYKPLQTPFYIGFTNGLISRVFTGGVARTDGFLAFEVGSVHYHSNNSSFIQGNRASIALGIFNYNLGPDKSIFNKPAFYMGVNLPVTNVIQFGLHIATDFKRENGDAQNNSFGASMRCSIGGLFNQYSMN